MLKMHIRYLSDNNMSMQAGFVCMCVQLVYISLQVHVCTSMHTSQANVLDQDSSHCLQYGAG